MFWLPQAFHFIFNGDACPAANDLQIGLQKIPGPEMLTSSEIKERNQLKNSENGFNHVFIDCSYALKILALANKSRYSSVYRAVRWV